MPGSTFGQIFKITTYGESHGKGIGVVIDGCPAGINITEEDIAIDLDRRRPGQSAIVTQRKESDTPHIMSGVFEGVTTGTPINIFIPNEDQRSKDYSHIKDAFRPSHADFTYQEKYGVRDYRGGGRSSARETAARVAAGVIAKKLLATAGVTITAYVDQVGHIQIPVESYPLDFRLIESNPVRCPDTATAEIMESYIKEVRKDGDTVGGVVSCLITGCPVGLGEPVFDRLHADLGKGMLSINAVKGFQYGSGFRAASMRGSAHNDLFENIGGKISTKTNNSGGIQGGISNGMDIYFSVAFKPVATIVPAQESVDKDGNPAQVEGKGRHDPCVVPRAVPIVEAMAALVLADHFLRARVAKL
ncbi:MAG: chorismate synthase [Saprospiraceae bacterium]|nr:chorismate synthase [Saprospiraceae bacterium]